MTKEDYFTMCEHLGTEPIESEIPVELDDLPLEVQQALLVYRMLKDDWEGFNGIYLGKSYIGLTEILHYTEVEPQEHKIILTLIRIIDGIRSNILNEKQKKPAKQ
jgi:hypothetical protein